jgi:hypothetical protein
MRHLGLLLGVLATAILSTGCAITDYDGFAQHQTQAEAKLWGSEISFVLGDPNLDGTYSYTVKYDNRAGRDSNMKIISYRNPVPSSFSRDGQIDRDGDDVQGRSGILGGQFQTIWVAVDPLPDCQFDANITQDKSHGAGPLATLCATVQEEIDKDLDLQASFSSTGDLLSKLWSGAVSGGFTMELTGVKLGGVNVPLAQPVSIGARSNGLRPMQLTVDLTQPNGKALLQAIVDHTADGVPVSLGLNFVGGMAVDMPGQIRFAFHHAALRRLL